MKYRLPFIYRMVQGAIGKRFVIKHYHYGKVMTKYPDMTGIVPSEAQKARRRLFRLAVKYAQEIYAKPELKEEKRRMLRRPKRLFQALMKEWFNKRKERAYWNKRRLTQWQLNAEMQTVRVSIPLPVAERVASFADLMIVQQLQLE